jgi:hypothetical protein
MKCMNCGSNFETPYCGQCGQEAAAARITLAEIRRSAARTLSFERGWLRTFTDLTLRPGKLVRDYLDGKRVVLIAPFKYAIAGFAVYLLVVWAVGTETTVFGMGLDEEFQQRVAELTGTVVKWVMLAVCPLRAGAAWLLFRRRGLTFAEHLAMDLFIFGQTAILYAVNYAACLLSGIDLGYSNLWLIPCLAAYNAWTFRGVCARSAWSAAGGGATVELLGLAATLILGTAFALVWVLVRFASGTP